MQQQQISLRQHQKSQVAGFQREFQLAKVIITSPSEIYTYQRLLKASITLLPKQNIYNSPIQVDIKGFSCLHNFETIKSNRKNQFQMTESCFIDGQNRIEDNLIAKVNIQNGQVPTEVHQNKSKVESQQLNQGQYFLQGSLVLFQIDEQNQQRLQSLSAEKRYEYPIEFTLPPNLPASLQNLLLKSIHISIKYTLQLKFSFCKVKERKSEQHSVNIPFRMIEQQKVYPFQSLVVMQDIRCYHQNGKKEDQFLNNYKTRFVRCLCSNSILSFYIKKKKMYFSKFDQYDLHHLQLLAAVSKDDSIYLIVRAYKDPDHEQLTQNRDKKTKDAKIKQVNQLKSMRDTPPDVSLVSIKETSRKQTGLNIIKVEVTMWGEITNLCKEIIFQKAIHLTNSNYDMLEGQCLVQLKDYLQYTKSCHNQLFSLRYNFTLKAFFNQEDFNPETFETFLIIEQTNQLIL